MNNIHLRSFALPEPIREEMFLHHLCETCYTTAYPFGLFANRETEPFYFEPVTLLCGGNGCGKSTILNLIAAGLNINRNTIYNRSVFFDDYADMCGIETDAQTGQCAYDGRIITSDDVFDYLFNVRGANERVDTRREEALREYVDAKQAGYRFRGMEDYDELKRFVDSRRLTRSEYARRKSIQNIRERSNGESALMYFTENITENRLYLLDEPENSLSTAHQIELSDFLLNSARFFGCQFIIATHSPCIAAMRGARVYDLDSNPLRTCRWTELEGIREMQRFFEAHRSEFSD